MIILSCILSILIFHSSSKDTSILLDPKSEFVDYVIPINAKVMVYNDEQLKDFKENHKQDKLIDMTKKLVLNDENIHDKFPTGNIIFRAHFIRQKKSKIFYPLGSVRSSRNGNLHLSVQVTSFLEH